MTGFQNNILGHAAPQGIFWILTVRSPFYRVSDRFPYNGTNRYKSTPAFISGSQKLFVIKMAEFCFSRVASYLHRYSPIFGACYVQ